MSEDESDLKRREAAAEAGQELDRYNAELSGTLAGYRGRHLPEDHDSKPGSRERKADKERAARSRLDMLLADPAYADLYNETFDMLRDAEAATEAALAVAVDALDKAGTEFDDLMDRANTLPDGTMVFRDPVSGTVYDQHGNQVTGDDLVSIVWKDGAPDYNDYRASKSAVDAAQKRIDDLRRFQDRLGGYRNRLEDPDNPPSADDLRDIQDDMNRGLSQYLPEKDETTHEASAQPTSNLNLPPIGS